MNDLDEIHAFSDEALEDNATVNGWVIDNLGKIPEVGDRFTYENLSVEVVAIDGKRASEILVTVHPEPNEDEENADDDRERDRGKDKDKEDKD